MALITVALAFLGVWSIPAQEFHKSIAPKQILNGGEVTVFCDADLAAVPRESTNRGIYELTLRWKGHSYEAVYSVQGGLRSKIKRHWSLKHYGTDHKNSFGYFDMDTFRLVLDIININPDDQGEFCCDSVFVRQKDSEVSTGCQDVKVSQRAIIKSQEGYKIITCDASLAGVPDTASELQNVSLFWKNTDFDSNYLLYEITVDPNNREKPRVNLIKPSGKDHWHPVSYSKNLKPNMRIHKYQASVGVVIVGSIVQDSGWFCCSATYFVNSGATKLSQSCHYLSAGEIEPHSYNRSSIKTDSERLILGLLVFLTVCAQLLYG